MKFYKPGEDRAIATNGTFLQATISESYEKLAAVFGEPTGKGDDYKSDAEWDLVFEDGTVATIYNYKDGKNYLRKDGLPVELITRWHIGGHTVVAAQRILECIVLYKKEDQGIEDLPNNILGW